MDTSSAEGGAGQPPRVPDRLFRALVDATAHPFLVLAPDGTILYAGASITDLLGWHPDELVGANMVDFLPPDEVERAAAAFDQFPYTHHLECGLLLQKRTANAIQESA